MEASERSRLVNYLTANRERVRSVVADLTPERLTLSPGDGEWSAAECLEHIIVVEDRVFRGIQRSLGAAPQPENQAAAGKDRFVLELVPAREGRRVKAPDAVLPAGRWVTLDELTYQFQQRRDRTLNFASTTEVNLRHFFFPHMIAGDLDCYQWMLFLGAHCERHIRQLEEGQARLAAPAAASS